MSKQERRPERLTARAFEEKVAGCRRAVLPVGSLEAHGTHAPIGLDTFVAAQVAAELAEAADCLLFPPIWYTTASIGYEARDRQGTLSVDAEVQYGYLAALAAEIARKGVDQLVFVNGHGPNGHLLELAAYKVWQQTGMAVGVLEWWSAAGETIREIKGFGYGNHADEIETSLLLATPEADLVNLDAATVNPFGPDVDEDELYLYHRHIRFTHQFDERWVGDTCNFGDPTRATAEKGQRLISQTVQVGCRMFRVLERYVNHDRLTALRKGGRTSCSQSQ